MVTSSPTMMARMDHLESADCVGLADDLLLAIV